MEQGERALKNSADTIAGNGRDKQTTADKTNRVTEIVESMKARIRRCDQLIKAQEDSLSGVEGLGVIR